MSAKDKTEIKKQKKDNFFLQKPNAKGRHINKMLVFLRFLCIPFIWIILPFRFYGNKKVKDGACIYVLNHYRIWDVAYPACTTMEGIRFIGKESLTSNWFTGGFCKYLGLIGAKRDGKDVKVIMNSLRILKNNEKMAIFPEGTRNKTEAEMLPFHGGAAMLAIKAKVPLIPIMSYEKARPFHLNHILIGEPFELSEYYDKKMTNEEYDKADEEIREKMLLLRQEHKLFLNKKKKK